MYHESPCPSFETLYLFMAVGSEPSLYHGYGLLLSCESIYLVKQNKASTIEALGFVAVSELAGTWTHFDITRNSTTSEMKVFINATSSSAGSSLQAVDMDYATSDHFIVKGVGCDCYIDNIAVVGEILLTESMGTESTESVETTSSNGSESGDLGASMYLLGTLSVGVFAILVLTYILRKK